MVQVRINFDGSCKNQKGSNVEPTGNGVAVFINGQYSKVFSKGYEGEPGTNNTAEWEGCVNALKTANEIYTFCREELKVKPLIEIYSDSQLIVNQFNDVYQTNIPLLRKWYKRAKDTQITSVVKELKWIRRTFNKEADKLAGEARQRVLSKLK